MDNLEKIEQINARISELKNILSAQSSKFGDWKLVKQFEASMQSLPAPYSDEEMAMYHTTRTNIRNEINKLESQLMEETK